MTPPPKNRDKYFSGNYHVKFGHFVNFSYIYLNGLISNRQINDACDKFRLTQGTYIGAGGIFITGIFGNFYTKRGESLTFTTGIPGGLVVYTLHYTVHTPQFN